MVRGNARKRAHRELLQIVQRGGEVAVAAVRAYKASGRWGCDVLIAAVKFGRWAVIAALAARGDVDPGTASQNKPWSALSVAAELGGGRLRALLAAFPTLTASSDHLCAAVWRPGSAGDVALLLDAGADPRVPSSSGEMVADLARRWRNFAAVALIERQDAWLRSDRHGWIRASLAHV